MSSLGPDPLDLLEYMDAEIRQELNPIYRDPEQIQINGVIQKSEQLVKECTYIFYPLLP